jgi:hypothetical protein
MNPLMRSKVDSLDGEACGGYRSGFDTLLISNVGNHRSMVIPIRSPIDHLGALRRDDLDQLLDPPEISTFTKVGNCFENGHHTHMIEEVKT